MLLSIQIKSLLFSFIYGIFFFIMLEINYKFIYNDKIIIKMLFTFIFVFFHTLLYFICLIYINNGIVHVYFLLMILVGFIISFLLYRRFFK